MSNAMSAFRTALGQLQQNVPQVNSDQIYAPYRASEAVTGQLGQGLQQSLLNSGQAAQAQYGNAFDQAQQHAAQFGISMGAGANQSALQNTGVGALAGQTNAYAAAAPQAAAQWQALLERTAAAKVDAAQLQRSGLIASGNATLATNLPQAIRDEKTLANQQAASRANNAYLRSSLTLKGQQAYDQNILRQEGINAGVTKTKLQQQGANSRSAASIAAANSRAAAGRENSLDIAQTRAQKSATAKGLNITQALTALKPGGGSSSKAITGYKIAVRSWDGTPGTSGLGTHIQYLPVANTNKAPSGFQKVPNTKAEPIYGPASATPGSTTASQWDRAVSVMQAQNPTLTRQEAFNWVKQFAGPRPAK